MFLIKSNNRKPNTVTRFINSENHLNRDKNRVTVNLYTGGSNIKDGEISVLDIDNELINNNEAGIYKLSKLKVEPFARADLSVEKIYEIKTPVQLYIERSKNKLNWKHCNIKPFPKNKKDAKMVATQLVLISKLIYKGST